MTVEADRCPGGIGGLSYKLYTTEATAPAWHSPEFSWIFAVEWFQSGLGPNINPRQNSGRSRIAARPLARGRAAKLAT